MVNIAVLGSTGNIGVQALNVLSLHQDRYSVAAIAAGKNRALLEAQIRTLHPQWARLEAGSFDAPVRWLDSPDGLEEMASLPEIDVVLVAVTGFAGLPAVLAALRAGKRVLLANKEPLVAAGEIVMNAAKSGTLYPVDSEHSAIFQCLRGRGNAEPRRIVLTASGGPFRGMKREQMEAITPAQALRHPSWNMGPKITIDSATMMNKALEIIEARWLFDIPSEKIEVLIHPQSVIHSMVEFPDGSCIAQLGEPDMRVPILYALTCPERLETGVPFLDLAARGSLTFQAPDPEAFPALAIARRALQKGGLAPCTLNAANEIAVEAFLKEKIPFLQIAETVGRAVDAAPAAQSPDLQQVYACDAETRRIVREQLRL